MIKILVSIPNTVSVYHIITRRTMKALI